MRNFLFVFGYIFVLVYVRRVTVFFRSLANARNKFNVRRRLAELTAVSPQLIKSVQTVGGLLQAFGMDKLKLKVVSIFHKVLKGNGFTKANKAATASALDFIVQQFSKRNLVYRNLKGRVNSKYQQSFERIPPPIKGHIVLTYLFEGIDISLISDDDLTLVVAVYTLLSHTLPIGCFPEGKGKNKRHRFVKGSGSSRGIDLADAQYFMDLYEAYVTDVIEDEKFDEVLANYGIDDDMLQVLEDAYYLYLENPEADSAKAWQSYLSKNGFGWEETETSDDEDDSAYEERERVDQDLLQSSEYNGRVYNRFASLAERDYDDAVDMPDYEPEGKTSGNSRFARMVAVYKKHCRPGQIFLEGRTVIKMVKQPTGQTTMRGVLQCIRGVTWQWLSRWLSWLSGQQTILMPYNFPPQVSLQEAKSYCETHMGKFRKENPWSEDAFKNSTEFVYEFTTPLAMHHILLDQFPEGEALDPSSLDNEPEDSIPKVARDVYNEIDLKIKRGEIQFEAKHGNKELAEMLQIVLNELVELREEVRSLKSGVLPEGRCPDALQLVTPYVDNKIAFVVEKSNSKKRWAEVLQQGCYLTCVTRVISKGQTRCFTTAHVSGLIQEDPDNIYVVALNETVVLPNKEWTKGKGDIIFTASERLNRALTSTGSFKEQTASVKSQVALVIPRATSPTRFLTTVSARADLTSDGFVVRNITSVGDCGAAYVTPDQGVFAIHCGSYGEGVGNVAVPLLPEYFEPCHVLVSPAPQGEIPLGMELDLPVQPGVSSKIYPEPPGVTIRPGSFGLGSISVGPSGFSVPSVSPGVTTTTTSSVASVLSPPPIVGAHSAVQIISGNPEQVITSIAVPSISAVNPEKVVSNEGKKVKGDPKGLNKLQRKRKARKEKLKESVEWKAFQAGRKTVKQEGNSSSAVLFPLNSNSPRQ